MERRVDGRVAHEACVILEIVEHHSDENERRPVA